MQVSALDCGPAALRSVLAGHRLPGSYDELRELCQTDVDGTSVESLEEVSEAFGLAASEMLVPAETITLGDPRLLPAIAVVRESSGFPHFVVLWRSVGRMVQVMDPAVGRRWMTRRAVMDWLWSHTHTVSAGDWVAWMQTDGRRGLAGRLATLGVGAVGAQQLIDRLDPEDWRAWARLDASVHAVETVGPRGRRGRRQLLENLDGTDGPGDESYRVRASTRRPGDIEVTGAVLVSHAEGPRPQRPTGTPLAIAPARRPQVKMHSLVSRRAFAALAVLASLSAALELGLVLTAESFGAGRGLAPMALVALSCLLAGGLSATVAVRIGRRLENGLRLALEAAVSRLPDSYIRSRLAADLSGRAHSLPETGRITELVSLLATAGTLAVLMAVVVTVAAPGLAPLTVGIVLAVLGGAWLGVQLTHEPELRRREHAGAIAAVMLDAATGARVLRSHGGSRAMRRRIDGRIDAWRQASRRLARRVAVVQATQTLVTLTMAGAILTLSSSMSTTTAFAVAYAAFMLPSIGQQLAEVGRALPGVRTIWQRAAEPLAHVPDAREDAPEVMPPSGGARVLIEDVRVRLGAHDVLAVDSLALAPGEHVAVVGASGSGKSTLTLLLLGILMPRQGRVRIDGAPIDQAMAAGWRERVSWVSPDVHVFAQTSWDNVCYGTGACPGDVADVTAAVGLDLADETSLRGFRPRQAQLLRIAPAMLRERPALALLDEPLSDIRQADRPAMFDVLREHFGSSTLLYVTHNPREARRFDRVLVVDRGRIVEDDHPDALLDDQTTRFAALDRSHRMLSADEPAQAMVST